MKDKLLASGIAAGPLFLSVSLTQAFTRDGFDLSRHPLSLLSLGDLGWVQIGNFVAAAPSMSSALVACAVRCAIARVARGVQHSLPASESD